MAEVVKGKEHEHETPAVQCGWQLATAKAARMGYMPQDKSPLLSELDLSESWRSVIHQFPPGTIVYVHLEKGPASPKPLVTHNSMMGP